MIIVKMNNSTVECSIAASELREIGLTPESLMNGEQQSVSFMTQLNKEVGEQLGYNPEEEVLLMSKNMMADGSVRIFAVKMSNDDIQRTADRIREAALEMLSMTDQDKINAIKEMSAGEKGEALGSLFIGVTEQVNHIYIPDDVENDAEPSVSTKPVSDTERYLIEFDSLREAIRFAHVAEAFPVVSAALYKEDDVYQMVVVMKNDDDNLVYDFRKTCVEYAQNLLVNSPVEDHVTETAEAILPSDAIAHLTKMG